MTIQKTWLVTGNLGYIGSEVCAQLNESGIKVIGLDSLQKGLMSRVGATQQIIGNISDIKLVEDILRRHPIEGVIHLAANKDIAESALKPDLFWHENYELSVKFFDQIIKGGVKHFIFASTAAVYKEQHLGKLGNFSELSETLPNSIYGKTKLQFENYLTEMSESNNVKSLALRFFNIAGATKNTGWDHFGHNLIPIVFQNIIDNQPTPIFGDKFLTPDGTCIRDFLHVKDLANGVVRSVLEITKFNSGLEVINLGTGHGVSVLEVLKNIEGVTGARVKTAMSEPRVGDLVYAVAAAGKAKNVINWEAQVSFENIVRDAWEYFLLHNSQLKSMNEST
jgi:UDP-glucose 4-epimerase